MDENNEAKTYTTFKHAEIWDGMAANGRQHLQTVNAFSRKNILVFLFNYHSSLF